MNELKKYNQKRNFNMTQEPIGEKKKSKKKLRFVVQHHLASTDHYDFRLEWNGTLKSYAVPKGPSYNPKDKRLAVMVEDHPLDYRNFEGIIPEGNYGAGTVMLWDEGYWEPLDKPDFKKAFKFILHGERLKGKWTIIPFKENNYLLIKETDEYKGYKKIEQYKTSIRTKRTMSEIASISKKPKYSVEISNPQKVIFNNPRITKMNLVNYYEKVGPRMMPFLDQRLISTIRCPDGVNGTVFFMKHLDSKSKGVGKVKLLSKDNKKEDYYYFKDIEGIISEVQMNSFEFHIWGSKVKSLEKPDIIVFDLDPDKGLSLDKVREGVKDLKSILDDLSLSSYLKTSGGKGYHVFVPLKTNSWSNHRKIAKDIAVLMETKWPEKYTANVRKKNRKNKIFIDWIRNTRASTSVAPYSVRLRKGAPVSMPISWRELDKIKPNEITMEEAVKRLKRKDPWEDFFLN